MSDIEDLKAKHQVDHLLLLIGGNPLPNAISGNLLVKPNGKVTLIYSKETCEIARSIKKAITSVPPENIIVPEKPLQGATDRLVIEASIANALSNETGSIGLNYTGGTKAMSVHAVRKIEAIALQRELASDRHTSGDENVTTVTLSYLDYASRKMLVDTLKFDAVNKRMYYPNNSDTYQVGTFEFPLEKMLALHQWKLSPTEPPEKKVKFPLTAQAIAILNTENSKEWLEWHEKFDIETSVMENAWEELKPEIREVLKQNRSTGKRKEWHKILRGFIKRKQDAIVDIPEVAAFTPVFEALQKEFGITRWKLNTEQACIHSGTDLGDFKLFLASKWLETLTLEALHGCPEQWKIHDAFMSYKPQRIDDASVTFELDCVAVHGYQLFAFSCTVDDADIAKGHLFEVYIRARQLGGDAARLALVCNHRDPAGLKSRILRELELGSNSGEAISPGCRVGDSIAVFGKEDIPVLNARIQTWIKSCI